MATDLLLKRATRRRDLLAEAVADAVQRLRLQQAEERRRRQRLDDALRHREQLAGGEASAGRWQAQQLTVQKAAAEVAAAEARTAEAECGETDARNRLLAAEQQRDALQRLTERRQARREEQSRQQRSRELEDLLAARAAS